MGVYSLCTPTAPHSAQRQVVNGGSLATRDMIGRYSNRLGCFGWSDDWRPLATGGRVAKKRPKTRRNQAKRSRPAAKRDLVRRPKASAYAKRTATGRFTEMDGSAPHREPTNDEKPRRPWGAGTAIKATRVQAERTAKDANGSLHPAFQTDIRACPRSAHLTTRRLKEI